MALNSCIFAVFLFGVIAVSAEITYPFAMTTFLRGLNGAAVSAFKSIANNPSLSMNEKRSQLATWATQQSSDVQTAFNSWQQNMDSLIASQISRDDSRVASLSSAAQTLYSQTKTIAMNNDLSQIQICSQLATLYSSASNAVTNELKKAVHQDIYKDICHKNKDRKKRQMFQNYRYDSPESYESWERYNGQNRQGYQNGANLRNQGPYYYGN